MNAVIFSKIIKKHFFRNVFIGLLLNCAFSALSSQPPKTLLSDPIDVSRQLPSEMWQRATTDSTFWQKAKGREADTRLWHWSWSIAYSRYCSTRKTQVCLEGLVTLLDHPAAVVRGDAATQLGSLYKNAHNQLVLKSLSAALNMPANRRNRISLTVNKRIIHAIVKVGGPKEVESLKIALQSRPDDLSYLERLVR